MTNHDWQSAAPPRREPVVPPRRRKSVAASRRGERWGDGRYLAAYRRLLARHQRLIRRVAIGSGAVAGLLIFGCLALWWRLESGPIQLDIFTPWLASAIEENFGSRERVEVGGTQIERTDNGGAAVRIRDIVVRDPDGTVVASAPKAEVRVSGMSLLSGHMRAESLNLVGAEMAIRIESDGDVTVFAGANQHPIATASVPVKAAAAAAAAAAGAAGQTKAPDLASTPVRPTVAAAAASPPRQASDVLAALLSWIDGIGETGLDGHDLRELGLKNGNLTVDDRRTGKHWSFQDISLSVERPHGGGVVLTIGSDNAARPWALSASIRPTRDGNRSIALEAHHVSVSDILLALRLGDGNMQINLPFSASLRGEIGPDGVPQSLTGRISAEAGSVRDANDEDGSLAIDRGEFKLNWDAGNRVLGVPFQILSGGNRITLMAEIEAPRQAGGAWAFKIGGGAIVLTSAAAPSDQLILNRIAVRGRFDPAARRLTIDDGDLGNADGVGVAMSGNADYSGDLRLTAGFAANRMSADALKLLWPVFVAPKVRDWFNEHLSGGTLERMVIAVNAPLDTLKASGPPIPDDGLSLDATASDCVLRPVAGLPALHNADLNIHIVGRDAQIGLNKAIADLPSGLKLTLSSGLFEVPDTAPHQPPARVRFKLDGPVSAAAELLAMDRLRDASGAPFDPATTHGTMSAQVSLAMPLKPDLPPGSTAYAITVDATNFSAERMIMGQKVEAAALKVSANNQGYQLKGDVKIGGTPASLDYRQTRGDNDAEIKLAATLDETARRNLGLDPDNSISGAIPVHVTGSVSSAADHSGRFSVEADLTSARIDDYLPGWAKPAGKPARATMMLTTSPDAIRVDDLWIEGSGGGVKGAIELNGAGELESANFPSYGFSDGDRATLKVDRGPDGALRVTMRGDVYDGRDFVKIATGGPTNNAQGKRPPADLDFDLKLGAVVGFDGEALRSVDLKLSRRAGEIRSLALNAKIGRDANLTGELRSRPDGRQAVFVQSDDAGALFRFTDVYARMTGGQALMSMDTPSADNPTQQGTLLVRDFSIHDEAQLERAAANGADLPGNRMDFSSMKVDFSRSPGRVALRDGVVRGPILGGTIDGLIDYTADEVKLRGTLVPLYGANNLLGQLPVVGLFLGGQKEGLVGVTYEVVGRPGNPVLNVNPFSALAPGLLRKIFEFPAANDGSSAGPAPDPNRGAVDNSH